MSGSHRHDLARDLKYLTACCCFSPEVASALLGTPASMANPAHVGTENGADTFALQLTEAAFDGTGQRMSRAALRIRRAADV